MASKQKRPPRLSRVPTFPFTYPPSRKTNIDNGHGLRSPNSNVIPNGKRRRRTSEEDVILELINRQIFAYGNKPEIKLTLFQEMYSCSDCCELFYTQSGLMEHHQREVFIATLNCPYCPLMKTFVNRCQLLNHFKSHGVTPTAETLKDILCFEGVPEQKNFQDYSIVILTNHPGYTPTAPTTVIPSQLDVAKTEFQKTATFSRGERQYKLIPVNNSQPQLSPLPALQQQSPVSLSVITGNWIPSYAAGSLTPIITLSEDEDELPGDYSCAPCGTTYPDLEAFMEHLKSSYNPTITLCTYDGIPCRSECEKSQHLRIYHDRVDPFICLDCGTEFLDFESLESHDKSVCFHLQKSVIYTCKYIDKKKISNGASEKDHQSYTCGNDGRFKKPMEIMRHMQEHCRFIHKCGFCPQAVLSDDLLQTHIATSHKDESQKGNQNSLRFFQCLLCDRVFATKQTFNEHFQPAMKEHCEHSIGYYCTSCSTCFSSREGIRTHYCENEVEEMLVEPLVIANKGEKRNREHESHPIKDAEDPKCLYCKDAFPTQRSLRRHQPNCAMKYLVLAVRKPEYCKLCSKTFQGLKSFLAHSITHINASFKICLLCNNQLLDESENLEDHLKAHSEYLRPYPVSCILCDKELRSNEEATFHFLSHHDKDTNRFKCATCGKQVNTLTELTQHKLTKHSDSALAVAAPISQPSTPSVSNSTVSQGINNGHPSRFSSRCLFVYTYQCKFCPERKFQTRPGLRKHIRNHHPNTKFTDDDWHEMRKITRNYYQPTKSTRRNSPTRNRRTSHTTVATDRSNEVRNISSTSDEEEVPRVNARDNGVLTCLKCSDDLDQTVFTSETDFYEHIRTGHVWKEQDACEADEMIENDDREDGTGLEESLSPKNSSDSNYWCPECGLEFVAKPSFRMHLQFAHDYIKKVDEYIYSIGYGNMERPMKENQCFVCKLICEDKISYERHIRTHGMAFLRQRLQK